MNGTPQKKPPSKRRNELVLLNVWFCLGVFLYHILARSAVSLNRLSWQFALIIFIQRLICVSLLGFFFLSGLKMTAFYPKRKTLAQYYRSRLARLLPPYIIASIITYLTLMALNGRSFSWKELVLGIIRGDLSAPFYFVIVLLQFTLLTPLFRRLAEQYSAVILLPPALILTQLSSQFFATASIPVPQWLAALHSRHLFTDHLFYYLAGCCAGAHYEEFLTLLKQNRPVISPLFFSSALLNVAACILCYSGRADIPYLQLIHILYYISGLLYLTDLALRLAESKRTFRLAQRIDRAGYLIYLYHGLAITLFNIAATRLSITRYGTQILLQLLLVLPAVIGGSLLWQRLWASFKKQVTPSPLHQ